MKHSHTFTEPRIAWHHTIEADEQSWPLRWAKAKGTPAEKICLLSIAAQARTRDFAIWCAAFDAATRPDERDEHIADLERLFDEAAEQEAFAERCEAYEMRTGRDWDTSASLWFEDDEMRPVASTYGMGGRL